MGNLGGNALVFLGGIILLHAGYSTIQYQEYIKLAEISDAWNVSSDILMEICISFICTLFGVLWISGTFLPIRSNDCITTTYYDFETSCPDFYIFNHRGRMIYKRMLS